MVKITFTLVSQISSLIPLIIGLIYYKNLNKPFKRLVCFFAFSVAMEFGANILANKIGNNMPLLHFFSLVEFAMFTYMFFKYFDINIKQYYFLVAMFLLIAILDALFFNSIYKFNSLTRTLMCVTLIIASLYFYYSNIKSYKSLNLYTQPMYWFSTAVIIYFSINFFTFMMMSFFQTSYSDIALIGSKVHACVNVVANIIFTVSFVSFKWNR